MNFLIQPTSILAPATPNGNCTYTCSGGNTCGFCAYDDCGTKGVCYTKVRCSSNSTPYSIKSDN